MIHSIIFDLDDTLFNTSKQTVPFAIKESCEIMIKMGLNTDVKSCIKYRKNLSQNPQRPHPYKALAHKFGLNPHCNKEQVIQAGEDAFYKRKIKEDIDTFPYVKETLSYLAQKYHLFLVSAGDQNTQSQKVQKLKISSFFLEKIYVPYNKPLQKQKAFISLLEKTKSAPHQFLCVGNSLDKEIKEANAIGMITCHILNDSYIENQPQTVEEIPNFQIKFFSELLEKCKL